MKSASYSFEKFSGFNTRNSEPTVSITRAKAIGLSSAFCEQKNILQYRFAVLYYDRVSQSIGFRPTNNEQEESKFAITPTHKGKGKGASIVAITFFSYYKIPVDQYAGKYTPKEVPSENMKIDASNVIFVIDLKEKRVSEL